MDPGLVVPSFQQTSFELFGDAEGFISGRLL